jgi:predicted nucleotidyltransferase
MDTGALGTVLLGKTRGAVLGLLLNRPDEEFYVRQIARLSGASLGPVQRELKVLAGVGILKCRQVGHQLLYSADLACPVGHELSALITKTVGLGDVLRRALNPVSAHVRVAFIFGSFARGQQGANSDVDLMLIGNVTFAAVAKALGEPQRILGREINPNVYRPSEFAAKIHAGQHFVSSVLNAPKAFLIGDEDELSRVAKERIAPPAHKQHRGDRGTPLSC